MEISINQPEYSVWLKEIPDPPEKLFVWGNPAVWQGLVVAVVGSRKPTDYGIRVANYLSKGLRSHVVLASGLAYGLDTVALQEAVDSPHSAIAVIGSGLDRENFYPKSNWQLAQKIVAGGGAIISEYPLGTPPLKHHFPARNRIIAGLSRGVIVVEAGERSGALITAQFALEFGREVWAVAGNIFSPATAGNNQLVKDGARLITSPGDVLDDLGIAPDAVSLPLLDNLTPDEKLIVNILMNSASALSVDELIHQTRLDTTQVSSTLTLMEIKGMVQNTGAGKYHWSMH